MIPVILSGGSGTRLWPLSRSQYPKQFCDLFGDSFLKLSVDRLAKLGEVSILTSEKLKTLSQSHLSDRKNVKILAEPEGRNTAPAIAYLCKILELEGKASEVVGIFPADHLIQKESVLLEILKEAEKLAAHGQIVTLGIRPTRAETGFGYIEMDGKTFKKFHEKPDSIKAEQFSKSGNHFWNAGIFVFKVSTMIEHFKKLAPEVWTPLENLKKDLSNLKISYSQTKKISVDYAIMEKLTPKDLSCLPADIGWEDVGSWDAVDSLTKNKNDMLEVESSNNKVIGDDKKTYAFVGVADLILVDTADAILVAKKGETQKVKNVVEILEAKKSKKASEHVFEERPWGGFEILRDENHFKSKVLWVNPMSQISYQSHAKREEHWIITVGKGEVILNDQVIPVQAGSHIHIPLGAKHRIRNTTNARMEFVEVQLGNYFGEDDIVRYQDDYQRK